MKYNPFAGFWTSFRREPFSYFVCYAIMAFLLVILHKSGTSPQLFSKVLAIIGAVLSSIFLSFAIQRHDIDGASLTLRGRLSYVISALAYLVLFCRFGFPEVFLGSASIYVVIALLLFFIMSPVIEGESRSDQADTGKPDPTLS